MASKLPTKYTPVELRARHDGWTAQKQIAFLEALADTACIDDACRHVGMSDTSAYRLRRHPSANAFRAAWYAAVDHGLQRLEQEVISRAVNGVSRPVFYKGEQVGEWRKYDERLAMFLLSSRRPERFGKWIDRTFEFESESGDETACRFDDRLFDIEVHGDRHDEEEEEDDDSPHSLPE
ncbi:MAG: hypothetical protein ACJ8FT_01365 [Sphingomonas sp.]